MIGWPCFLCRSTDVNRSSVGRLSSHFMKQPRIVIMNYYEFKAEFHQINNRSHLLMRVP